MSKLELIIQLAKIAIGLAILAIGVVILLKLNGKLIYYHYESPVGQALVALDD